MTIAAKKSLRDKARRQKEERQAEAAMGRQNQGRPEEAEPENGGCRRQNELEILHCNAGPDLVGQTAQDNDDNDDEGSLLILFL